MDTLAKVKDSVSSLSGDYFGLYIPDINFVDVVEVIILAFFFYRLLAWCKNSRAWTLLKGILVILLFFIIAALLQMNTILWLGEKLLGVALVAIVILFQPELRKALDGLGSKSFRKAFRSLGMSKSQGKVFSDRVLNDIVKASFEMGAVRTGALIVFERDINLAEYERTGINLDSLLSKQLLINIFEKNTPLHDGAVIVKGDRVVSATCYLPLSDNNALSKDLGTRHRAALGISEVTDAVTIVVSEETGKVSVAKDGKLLRDVSPEQLEEELLKIQRPNDFEDDNPKGIKGLLKRGSDNVE